MVAEMSNESSSYIWHRMPYARGLQFQTTWFQKRGISCERPRMSARDSFRKLLG